MLVLDSYRLRHDTQRIGLASESMALVGPSMYSDGGELHSLC
jgi:hypothetical protein